ncbi:hypothetical protein [Spirosoma validum]|uniref:Lipoprotein n=1 Tax=Spirosoma validum TaxID=2771355 RepID=A0A927GHC6_9BACT|nr:hypothetical protein [Spirosoma validum]MBD2757897.1 hypothetical protein [Spirosoma validum]
MKTLLLLALITSLLAAVSSCQNKEELAVKSGCDCQGEPSKVIDRALAIHNKSLISILDPEHLQQGWQLYTATYFNPDFIRGKVNEIDTVYVSGNLRGPCNYGDFNYHSRLEVTEIRRK